MDVDLFHGTKRKADEISVATPKRIKVQSDR